METLEEVDLKMHISIELKMSLKRPGVKNKQAHIKRMMRRNEAKDMYIYLSMVICVYPSSSYSIRHILYYCSTEVSICHVEEWNMFSIVDREFANRAESTRRLLPRMCQIHRGHK